MSEEYITMSEAQILLNVSRTKMWKLVKDSVLDVYDNPLDKRNKLVKRVDVEKLKNPKPK